MESHFRDLLKVCVALALGIRIVGCSKLCHSKPAPVTLPTNTINRLSDGSIEFSGHLALRSIEGPKFMTTTAVLPLGQINPIFANRTRFKAPNPLARSLEAALCRFAIQRF